MDKHRLYYYTCIRELDNFELDKAYLYVQDDEYDKTNFIIWNNNDVKVCAPKDAFKLKEEMSLFEQI